MTSKAKLYSVYTQLSEQMHALAATDRKCKVHTKWTEESITKPHGCDKSEDFGFEVSIQTPNGRVLGISDTGPFSWLFFGNVAGDVKLRLKLKWGDSPLIQFEQNVQAIMVNVETLLVDGYRAVLNDESNIDTALDLESFQSLIATALCCNSVDVICVEELDEEGNLKAWTFFNK